MSVRPNFPAICNHSSNGQLPSPISTKSNHSSWKPPSIKTHPPPPNSSPLCPQSPSTAPALRSITSGLLLLPFLPGIRSSEHMQRAHVLPKPSPRSLSCKGRAFDPTISLTPLYWRRVLLLAWWGKGGWCIAWFWRWVSVRIRLSEMRFCICMLLAGRLDSRGGCSMKWVKEMWFLGVLWLVDVSLGEYDCKLLSL